MIPYCPVTWQTLHSIVESLIRFFLVPQTVFCHKGVAVGWGDWSQDRAVVYGLVARLEGEAGGRVRGDGGETQGGRGEV
jgi:hypothetical protein